MYQERMQRVKEEMDREGISQLLLCDPFGIYYLTGLKNFHPFERFWAILISLNEEPVVFSNKLFHIGETDLTVITLDDTDDTAEYVASRLRGGVLGVDKNLPARRLLPIMDKLPELKVKLGSDCIDRVRACKDEQERKWMREVSEINDQCIQQLASFIHEGVTEKECTDYLAECYAACGCEGLAFDSIVSFGANAADPHHEADDTVIQEGDCIVIDIGCRKNHYCSDMTRTYFWKKMSGKAEEVYDVVRKANEKAEAMIRPGVRFCDIDAAARNHIAAAGYGPYFTHRLGHFIGMEDHETGDVSSTNTEPARENQIFSIEPGVYLPGELGVRVEDLVLVTKDGIERLNHVSKEPVILGI